VGPTAYWKASSIPQVRLAAERKQQCSITLALDSLLEPACHMAVQQLPPDGCQLLPCNTTAKGPPACHTNAGGAAARKYELPAAADAAAAEEVLASGVVSLPSLLAAAPSIAGLKVSPPCSRASTCASIHLWCDVYRLCMIWRACGMCRAMLTICCLFGTICSAAPAFARLTAAGSALWSSTCCACL
jgi:hypothetical protein